MKVPLNKDYHQWTWEEYFFFSPCHWCSCCCREIFSFQSQTHPDPPIIDLYCQNCGSVLRSCPATYIGFASCKNVKFQYLRDLPGCFKKNRESKCWWKWKRFSHPFPIVPGSSKT